MIIAILGCFTLLAAAAWGQPVVNWVANPASNVPPGAPIYALAPGSFIEVEGARLGPSRQAFARGLPLVTELEGVSIEVTVGQTKVAPYLLSAAGGRVLAILPSGTPAGTGTLTATYNGQTSAPFAVRVAGSAFGFFTLNGIGSGPALAIGTDLQPRTVFRPFRPGEIAIALGSGVGTMASTSPVSPADNSALEEIIAQALEGAGDGETTVGLSGEVEGIQDYRLLIEDSPVPVLYFGPAGIPGTNALIFTVPDRPGCHVPIRLEHPSASYIPSNVATLSIGRGMVCEGRFGHTAAERQSYANKQTIRLGGFSRLRRWEVNFQRPSDPPMSLNAGFFSVDEVPFQPFKDSRQGSLSCQAWNFFGETDQDPLDKLVRFVPVGGLVATLPNGSRGTIPEIQGFPGIYGAQLPDAAYSAGVIGLQGSGTDNFRPFTTQITFDYAVPNTPPTIGFPSARAGMIRRNEDLMIQAGGWPDVPGHVRLRAGSFSRRGNFGGTIDCTYDSRQMSLSVPKEILRRLPPSEQLNGGHTGFVDIQFVHDVPASFNQLDVFRGQSRIALRYNNVQFE